MENLKNQITNKAGFLIYRDYWEKYFSKMTGEQVKEVFKIIFHFNLTFEVLKTDDLAVEMVVATIIDNIKRDAMKRAKKSIASAKNGKLGGRPIKDKKPTKTQQKPKANPEKPTKTQSVFSKPTIEEIKNYCLERKNNVDAERFFNHYEANGWKVGRNSMKDWKACVITWEKNNFNNQPKTTGMPKPNYNDPNYYADRGGWDD